MKRIGILGGTFNPVHNGHLALAQSALGQLSLEEVWLMPSGRPYMKNPADILPGAQRLLLLTAAVEGLPSLRVLEEELWQEGNTYTYETMNRLRWKYPDVRFFFLAGSDILFQIGDWKNPQAIFNSCSLGVAVRGNQETAPVREKAQALRASYGADIRLFASPRMEVSASEVRERLAGGLSVRSLAPGRVCALMERYGFYGCSGEAAGGPQKTFSTFRKGGCGEGSGNPEASEGNGKETG